MDNEVTPLKLSLCNVSLDTFVIFLSLDALNPSDFNVFRVNDCRDGEAPTHPTISMLDAVDPPALPTCRNPILSYFVILFVYTKDLSILSSLVFLGFSNDILCLMILLSECGLSITGLSSLMFVSNFENGNSEIK